MELTTFKLFRIDYIKTVRLLRVKSTKLWLYLDLIFHLFLLQINFVFNLKVSVEIEKYQFLIEWCMYKKIFIFDIKNAKNNFLHKKFSTYQKFRTYIYSPSTSVFIFSTIS